MTLRGTTHMHLYIDLHAFMNAANMLLNNMSNSSHTLQIEYSQDLARIFNIFF